MQFVDFIEKLGKVANLEIAARKIVEGFMLGIHKSPYHGFSAEFSQYRPYNTGDDIRRLDWKLFARSEKYYVKEYEEETNLRAHFFLDSSQSMAYRYKGLLSKFQYGKYLVAAMAYLFQRQKDAVGFVVGVEKVKTMLQPSTKSSNFRELLKILNMLETGPAADLTSLIGDFTRFLPRAGMTIILSDFFCDVPQLFDKLKGMKHIGQDVILMQILDPMEIHFEYKEDGQFVDMESGEKITLSPKLVQKSFNEGIDSFIKEIHSRALDMGIDHFLFTTDKQFDLPLATLIRSRKKWL